MSVPLPLPPPPPAFPPVFSPLVALLIVPALTFLHLLFAPDQAPQPVFEFVHPVPRPALPASSVQSSDGDHDGDRDRVWAVPSEIDNSRFASLRFTAQTTGTIHGFAGYFECWLYRDIRLSILPASFSHDMFSWFPVLFPLRTPLPVRAGESVHALFWRRVTPQKVWYEWTLTAPVPLPLHNPQGRCHHMRTA